MAGAGIEAYTLQEDSRFHLVLGIDERARRVCLHRSTSS
jgi:hypothetical protein